MKYRIRVADICVTDCCHGASSNVALSQSDHDRDHCRTCHQSTPVLRLACEVFIKVYWVLVHAQQAQQRVIEFIDGAAGPVLEFIAGFEFVEILPVTHKAGGSQTPCRSNTSISSSGNDASRRIARVCSPTIGGAP